MGCGQLQHKPRATCIHESYFCVLFVFFSKLYIPPFFFTTAPVNTSRTTQSKSQRVLECQRMDESMKDQRKLSMSTVCVYNVSCYTPAHCPRHNPQKSKPGRQQRKWKQTYEGLLYIFALRFKGDQPKLLLASEKEKSERLNEVERQFESMCRNIL